MLIKIFLLVCSLCCLQFFIFLSLFRIVFYDFLSFWGFLVGFCFLGLQSSSLLVCFTFITVSFTVSLTSNISTMGFNFRFTHQASDQKCPNNSFKEKNDRLEFPLKYSFIWPIFFLYINYRSLQFLSSRRLSYYSFSSLFSFVLICRCIFFSFFKNLKLYSGHHPISRNK